MLRRFIMLSLVFQANSSLGQTVVQTRFDECPAPPGGVRWEAMLLPDMILCRAISMQTGDEAFALTISGESPFKPRRSERAELDQIAGQPLQWYRGTLPDQPGVQVREALIELSQDRVMHVSLRAGDQATLERSQQLVAGLEVAMSPLESSADETASAPAPPTERPPSAPEPDSAPFEEEAAADEAQESFEESASAQAPAADEAPEVVDEPLFDEGASAGEAQETFEEPASADAPAVEEAPEVFDEPSFEEEATDGEAQVDESEFETTDDGEESLQSEAFQ